MRLVRYSYPATRNQSPVFTSPFGGLENEIDRLFGPVAGELSARQIPVDLYEDKDNTYVRAELPGVDRAAINIEHSEGRLTIGATRKAIQDGAEKSTALTRDVSVPDHLVQADKISAAYENGVLTVTLPKREESKPRKVSVSVN